MSIFRRANALNLVIWADTVPISFIAHSTHYRQCDQYSQTKFDRQFLRCVGNVRNNNRQIIEIMRGELWRCRCAISDISLNSNTTRKWAAWHMANILLHIQWISFTLSLLTLAWNRTQWDKLPFEDKYALWRISNNPYSICR